MQPRHSNDDCAPNPCRPEVLAGKPRLSNGGTSEHLMVVHIKVRQLRSGTVLELLTIATYAYQDVHVWRALLTCMRSLATPPPPRRGDLHFDKNTLEMLGAKGAERYFSLGYPGTAAVLVPPLCGASPPPPPRPPWTDLTFGGGLPPRRRLSASLPCSQTTAPPSQGTMNFGGVPCAVCALCEKLAVLHHREFGKFRRLKGRH